MSTDQLGRALGDLVDGVEDDATAPEAADLWQAGSRRRLRARASVALAAAAVVTLVGALMWPVGTPRASVPASGLDASGAVRLTAHPAYLAKPPFASATARPGVTAAVVTAYGDTVEYHAVSPSGAVTRLDLPENLGSADGISLAPDGRWLARGLELHDLVDGTVQPSQGVRTELASRRPPVDRSPWWSPDSRRAYVEAVNLGTPVSSGLVLDTGGSVQEVPLLAGGSTGAHVAGWLDDDTLLAFTDVSNGSSRRLEARTWTLEDPEWTVAEPDLEWAEPFVGTANRTGGLRVDLSPDRTRVLVVEILTSRGEGPVDSSVAVEFDARTGEQLHPSGSDGVDVSAPGFESFTWEGSGCRTAWSGERPLVTNGRLHWVSLQVDGPPVEVSSRYGSPCTSFAGDEVRGSPAGASASVWQERGWTWGWRLLVLGAVVALVRWASRRWTWRETSRADLPPMSSPTIR